MRKLTAAGAVLTLMAMGCWGETQQPSTTVAHVRAALAGIRCQSALLTWPDDADQPNEKAPSPHVATYVAFYGLDLPCAQHAFGYISVGDERIATHVYVPQGQTRGTVIVSHGYHDHAATWRHAIRAMLAHGFTVLIYDQLGHGLSSGPRAAIGDFAEYVAVMKVVLAKSRTHLPSPYHVAAHSMGAAIATDYLLNDPEATHIDNVVLVAPLVWPAHWRLSTVGNWLSGWALSSVPRKFRKNSSDETYLAFVKQDPLHERRIPLVWVDALRDWNARAKKFKTSSRRILVIQGDDDGTVNAKHNLRVMKRLFPNRTLIEIANGEHQLLNESEPMRTKTINAMCSHLCTER